MICDPACESLAALRNCNNMYPHSAVSVANLIHFEKLKTVGCGWWRCVFSGERNVAARSTPSLSTPCAYTTVSEAPFAHPPLSHVQLTPVMLW